MSADDIVIVAALVVAFVLRLSRPFRSDAAALWVPGVMLAVGLPLSVLL